MLILSASTDALNCSVVGGGATVDAFASYRDIGSSTFSPGRATNALAGGTPEDLVAGPASGARVLDHVSAFNSHASVTATVTITLATAGDDAVLARAALAPGEKLEYTDGAGWRVLTSNGSVKQNTSNAAPVSGAVQQAVLAADVVNNNATANTIADVTGLSFPVTAGIRYRFRFVIDYTAAATATGSRWSINGPGSPTRLAYSSNYALTATSRTFNAGLSAYDLPAASNGTSASTGANIAIIEGFLTPTSDGTVTARFASEVASSAITAKAGSFVEWQAVA